MQTTRAEIVTVRFYAKDGSHDMPDARFVSWDRAHRAIEWWAEQGNGIGIVIAAQEVSAVSKDETPIPATQDETVSQEEVDDHRYSEYEDERAQHEDDEQAHEDDMSADEMRAAPNWWL